MVVIGEANGDLPAGVARMATLEEAIAVTGGEVDYLWILHSDARPRPVRRQRSSRSWTENEASLGGSAASGGNAGRAGVDWQRHRRFRRPYTGLR